MLPCALTYLLIFAGVVCGEGVRKHWVKNWDLDSATNWKEGKLPCPGKAAILPNKPSNLLFVGGDLTLGSLELPIDGQIILGAETNMIFDDQTDHDTCQDAKWSHESEDKWYDPDAWYYPGYKNTTYPIPVPDVNRIPCTRDTAVFPNPSNTLYTIKLQPPTVFVTSLFIANKTYTTSEFATYMRTADGKVRFGGASSQTGAPLYIESPGVCSEMTGCLCGTEAAATTICNIKTPRCTKPQCKKPLLMTGFCCPLCGAEVTISHNNTMPLFSVAALLKSHRSSSVMRGVADYLAKMGDHNYHIYFTASDENGDYKAASEAFKIKFNKELNREGKYSALVATSSTLIPVSQGVKPHHLAATLTTLIICLAIGAAVFYLKKRKYPMRPDFSFMFRPLENSSRRVSVVSDVFGGRRASTTSGVFSYSRESGLRFLNPIFNQSMASLAGAGVSSVSNDNAEVPVSSSGSSQVEGQHENPVYTAYQNMSPEEQQASEEAQKARERIRERAGQIVASIENSQVHFKGRKLSNPSGNDLGAIDEEKEATKHDENKGLEDKVGDTDNMNDNDKGTKDMTSGSTQEDTNTETTIIIPDLPEFESTDNDDKMEETEKTLEKDDGMETLSTLTPDELHERKDSTSTSSSEDDDASNALTNLEGFSPLVDLKFKK